MYIIIIIIIIINLFTFNASPTSEWSLDILSISAFFHFAIEKPSVVHDMVYKSSIAKYITKNI